MLSKEIKRQIGYMERVATVLADYPGRFRTACQIWEDVPGRISYPEMLDALARLTASGMLDVSDPEGYRLRQADKVATPPAVPPFSVRW